jgi:hypothetical protein
MASNSNRPWLRWVVELPVAALGSSDAPANLLKALDYVSDFHADNAP